MANEEHLAILRQGVEVWNEWRRQNLGLLIDLRGADLSGAKLSRAKLNRANLSRANLRDADLGGTNLRDADLSGAKLSGANLNGANLFRPNLYRADLSGTNLSGALLWWADLSGANLSGADLSRAKLNWANFSRANLLGATFSGADLSGVTLSEADLSGATFTLTRFASTTMTAVDLRSVLDLDRVVHLGPSSIGIDTLYRSAGNIPESFLRGCGVPDSMIEYARSLVTAARPIDYYSCFISYSSYDELLAQRLYADLQAAGVRCWYAPEDLKIGESILGGIDQGIRMHDKLLLLLSESSVQSTWVETEVKLALERERNERRRILFPVRIDDAVLTSRAAWAALIRADHHIGNFCTWKEHDAYQAVFARLLRDLRAG